MCVCACACIFSSHMQQHIFRGQKHCKCLLSLSTMWILGIELGSSLVGKRLHYSHLACSRFLKYLFILIYVFCLYVAFT